MFSKFEMIGAGICVGLMALAIYLVQMETRFDTAAQPAAAITSDLVVVSDARNEVSGNSISEVTEQTSNTQTMKIDDIKIGTGAAAASGDTVSVHYVGRLQNGTEFDSSRKRGEPFTFTIGAGQVIQGWETGVVGMQTGGERTLVIPPEMAYGNRAIGPIPPNSTLVFTIELLEIN